MQQLWEDCDGSGISPPYKSRGTIGPWWVTDGKEEKVGRAFEDIGA